MTKMHEHGFWLIHKIHGQTSADVLRVLKASASKSRWGHAGTLDPFATGLLIVLRGEWTKLQSWFMKKPKVYEFDICLGARTPSGDLETPIQIIDPDISCPSPSKIETICREKQGFSEQIPPLYSAIKFQGRPLYDYVRHGEIERIQDQLVTRKVYIHSLEYLGVSFTNWDESHHLPCLSFRVTCSQGTYVRVLAQDIARDLGTVGFCTRIYRTQIGPFHIKESYSVEEACISPDKIQTLFDMNAPFLEASPSLWSDVQNGRLFDWPSDWAENERFLIAPDRKALAWVVQQTPYQGKTYRLLWSPLEWF